MCMSLNTRVWSCMYAVASSARAAWCVRRVGLDVEAPVVCKCTCNALPSMLHVVAIQFQAPQQADGVTEVVHEGRVTLPERGKAK